MTGRTAHLCPAAVVVAAMMAIACDSPTAPTPHAPSASVVPARDPVPPRGSASLSGTVWAHTGEGVKPFANGRLFGWLEQDRSGSTTGAVPIGADGRYGLRIPGDTTRVRIHVAGVYQPCAVTLTPEGDITHDIHVVTDPLQLGARLPSPLMMQGPTLSGQVYEVADGSRRPVRDARVELDGLSGMGLVIATTLTDEEGRYVLCAVPHLPGLHLFASKEGYHLFEAWSDLMGRTTLDIELRRR
jgi:hypothetical protein